MGINADEKLKEIGIDKTKLDRPYYEAMKLYIIENEEKENLYKLFKAMTPSMKKAIVDIMKTVNGEEIDDRTNDIQ